MNMNINIKLSEIESHGFNTILKKKRTKYWIYIFNKDMELLYQFNEDDADALSGEIKYLSHGMNLIIYDLFSDSSKSLLKLVSLKEHRNHMIDKIYLENEQLHLYKTFYIAGEHNEILHKINNVQMMYTVSVLKQIVSSQKILWVVIFDCFKRTVFSFFC